jgi:endogenous inhibitor of DNA gyrase (YacG/DUF329 family)
MAAKCPTCGNPGQGKHKPFCSTRCAQADLGRWLSGHYAVPSQEEPESADLEALEKAIIEAMEDGTLVSGEFRRKD